MVKASGRTELECSLKFVLLQKVSLFFQRDRRILQSKLYRTAATIRNIPSRCFLSACCVQVVITGPAVCYLPLKLSGAATVAAFVSLRRRLCAGAVEKLVIEEDTAVLVAQGWSWFIKYTV